MSHKIINGIKVALTEAEIAEIQANETAWKNSAFDRAIADVRQRRNALLAATDYLALSDNNLSADMSAYRQALRDITNNITTIEEVNSIIFPIKP
jgi:hypothetical protein